MAFKCIIAMVKPEYTDRVVSAAKGKGATGATSIPASGCGASEAKTFFGLSIDVRTDVMIFLVEEEIVEPVMTAIKEAGSFDQPGTGIAFVLSVDQVAGIESQLAKTRS